MGRVEYRLKSYALAFGHLDRARQLNPLHKPTLLLLYVLYQKREEWSPALECIVDLFLLSKEVQDKYVPRYKKKIRELVAKITPPLDGKQKNLLIKDRNQHLNKILTVFENQIMKGFSPGPQKIEPIPQEIQLELAPVTLAQSEPIDLPPFFMVEPVVESSAPADVTEIEEVKEMETPFARVEDDMDIDMGEKKDNVIEHAFQKNESRLRNYQSIFYLKLWTLRYWKKSKSFR